MSEPEKVDLNKRYQPQEEIRTDLTPYVAYYDTLKEVFDFSRIVSFIDVGCATGHLINHVNEKSPHILVAGIEFFPYHKEHAPKQIRDYICIHDLRDSLPRPLVSGQSQRFDLVNCTEGGEHIDPRFVPIFLNNLKELTGKFLIMSWSDTGGENDRVNDPHHQHLTPLSWNDFHEMMISAGWKLNEELTISLISASYRPSFYPWWRKSLSV